MIPYSNRISKLDVHIMSTSHFSKAGPEAPFYQSKKDFQHLFLIRNSLVAFWLTVEEHL
jgi:hypothetical protein